MATSERDIGSEEGATNDERRARASTRIPFDGVVEIGAELGPPFEAQAVDVSGTGMHLRTAYLPEVGQAISCRFEAGRDTVIATGEVVWQKDAGRGGEFGLRFLDLDPESSAALERMTDRARLNVPGAKVRLHIEGLGAPMRARVKGVGRAEVKVGSELGFLEVGKHIDLEDAESGRRRPASIDRVEVEIHPSSRVPQLVVALKYEDEEETMQAGHDRAMPHGHDMDANDVAAPAHGHAHDDMAHDDTMMAEHGAMDPHAHQADAYEADDEVGHHAHAHDEDVPMSDSAPAPAVAERAPSATAMLDDDEESMRMKGPVARAASKVTPALERFAKRTKTTAMLLIERAKARRASESSPIRRMTAPPPGGSLHASGRKVVREPMGSSAGGDRPAEATGMAALLANKKKMTLIGASAVGILAVGVAIAARKPAAPPADATAAAAPAATDNAAATPAGAAPTAATPGAPIAVVPPGAPAITPTQPTPAMPGGSSMEIASSAGAGAPSASEPVVADKTPVGDSDPPKHAAKKVAIKVTPFTNGSVSRGNVLHLKMDGSIEKIQGAQQPTGFTVHIPGRRSLEPAAPLAARDARIGAIKVANEPGGAELSVTFKDGVPSYAVRAKGDQLEIVLASPSAGGAKDDTVAAKPSHKKDGKTVAKHGKHGGKHKH